MHREGSRFLAVLGPILLMLAAAHSVVGRAAAEEPASWTERFQLGGYGELHWNLGRGDTVSRFDIHRLVIYVGYRFADWITLHSETELEHAFVGEEGDGEVAIEQLHLDFAVADALSFRLGRILVPLGIINPRHEPPTFHGVERPMFARYVIPTTWSGDGLGVFGSFSGLLRYEAYYLSGLDGGGFSPLSGIRGGRQAGRSVLEDPALAGRLDLLPFAVLSAGGRQYLRLGLAAYLSGLGNASGDGAAVSGRLAIYSADLEYRLGRLELRAVGARERLSGYEGGPAGVAREIRGYYGEVALDVAPSSWRRGSRGLSGLVLFLRHGWLDTQAEMAGGQPADPRGEREETAFGVTVAFRPNLVLKADYLLLDDGTAEGLDDRYNFGLGWQF
jgi:hypothetical protein